MYLETASNIEPTWGTVGYPFVGSSKGIEGNAVGMCVCSYVCMCICLHMCVCECVYAQGHIQGITHPEHVFYL